jgi:pSer/pThr/pTyr-binding forkhead associated (FHA) protein
MGKVLLKYAGKKKEFASLAGLRDYAIGRNTDNDVVVEPFYTEVSRVHCTIQVTPDSVRVLDRDSRYGTYVNDEKLEPEVPKELGSGDRLRFGKHFRLDMIIQADENGWADANNTITIMGTKFLSLLGLR